MKALQKSERDTMKQLVAAFEERDKGMRQGACLVRSIRKRDGKEVAMLCRAISGTDGTSLYPLAVIVPEDEFDDYDPPR